MNSSHSRAGEGGALWRIRSLDMDSVLAEAKLVRKTPWSSTLTTAHRLLQFEALYTAQVFATQTTSALCALLGNACLDYEE